MGGAVQQVFEVEPPLLPRAVNAALGAWLFASTFLWRHSDNAGFADWLIGLFVFTTAVVAMYAPKMRWGSTFLAAALGLGALLASYPSAVARLHDLALAGAIGALSFWPARRERLPEQAVT